MTGIRAWLFTIGGALLVVGGFLGLAPIRKGVSCGSAWLPDFYVAKLADAYTGISGSVSACQDAIGSRGIIAWVLAGFGAAILVGVMFLYAAEQQRLRPSAGT